MSELPLQKVNDEVFIATDDIVQFDQSAVDFIKKMAMNSPRGRARICAHKHSSDNLHEMLIAILSDSYIRPHRHHNKVESFHLIDGRADVVILDDAGDIVEIVQLGKEHNFYYRLNKPHYHTLIIHSPILVIHEITNGPFDVKASDYAAFSPADDDKVKSSEYVTSLKQKMAMHATE